MQEYLFQSKESKNLLKLLKDENNIIWIKECCIDDSSNKFVSELFSIIKLAFNAAKETGATHLSQLIKKDEWDKNKFFNLDNRWKLIDKISDQDILIQCDINYASECIIDQFLGLKQNEYFYESNESDNLIKLFKDTENNVWIENYFIDKSKNEFIFEFCRMIQNAFKKAQEEGGEYHSQYVELEEWENFLKSDERWELIEKLPNNIIHIQCDINDAAGCVIEAFIGNQEKIKNENENENN